MKTIVFNDMENNIKDIEARLKKGEIGIFPCDTIYGICSMVGEEQKERILKIKERSPKKSFISLVNFDYLKSSNLIVPQILYNIWPAPLTAILANESGDTFAVRVPLDKYLTEILKNVGAIYSTSVNISSHESLQDANEIIKEFSGKVDFIVKADTAKDAKPSTIINFTKTPYTVIREGAFDASSIL